MLFRHYRALATTEEGKAWFGIMPPTEEKIIPITAAA